MRRKDATGEDVPLALTNSRCFASCSAVSSDSSSSTSPGATLVVGLLLLPLLLLLFLLLSLVDATPPPANDRWMTSSSSSSSSIAPASSPVEVGVVKLRAGCSEAGREKDVEREEGIDGWDDELGEGPLSEGREGGGGREEQGQAFVSHPVLTTALSAQTG